MPPCVCPTAALLMGTKAGAEKSSCEHRPISVSDGRRSCLGNRIPSPPKRVEKKRAGEGWLSHSSIKRLQEMLENENQEARLLTQPVLDTEKGFIKDLDSYLSHRGTLELRRKELLHMRWTERVWTPIQKNIRDHLSSCHGNEEEMRRAILRYVQHCNAKGFVSLESYDPNEYDPFLYLINGPRYSKVSVPFLKDPLSLQLRERAKETRVVLRCQTGRVFSHRHTEELLKLNLTHSPLSYSYGASGVSTAVGLSGATENSYGPNRYSSCSKVVRHNRRNYRIM